MARVLTLPGRKSGGDRRPWHGMAFIMEALILLVFLIISTTILLQVFNASRIHSAHADALSSAVILASNEAELFSADPEADTTTHFVMDEGVLVRAEDVRADADDVFTVTRSVSSQNQGNGTLYRADITVERADETVYELSTSHYLTFSSSEVSS